MKIFCCNYPSLILSFLHTRFCLIVPPYPLSPLLYHSVTIGISPWSSLGKLRMLVLVLPVVSMQQEV